MHELRTVLERIRAMGRQVRDSLQAHQAGPSRAAVSHESQADTIYAVDAEVEPVIDAFCAEWGRAMPIVLVAEGLRDDDGREQRCRVYPRGTDESRAAWRLIIDPIDGTRGLMVDKRSAWTLIGVAPNRGDATRLRQVVAACMTELPTSKHGYADELWAVRGHGAYGERVDLRSGERQPLPLAPSTAGGITHGFASVSDFFPGTKGLAAELVERIVAGLVEPEQRLRGSVFNDQYVSTGGQWYELVVGHDRFNADLRPEFYRMQRREPGLCCHPYDCAALLVAEEAGVVITDAQGTPLDAPLDTTSSVSWVGYANARLRERIEPIVRAFLAEDRG